jgi:hypothetical protein
MDNNQSNRVEVIFTVILFLVCGAWLWYDYSKNPKTIPFEPIVAFLAYIPILIGYIFIKQKRNKNNPSNPNSGDKVAGDKKTYNIDKIDHANFS